MSPKIGRSKSKDQARPLRRLSVANKDDKKGNAKLQKGPSITSFFKNTPPSKLACPLCGKFVPRFKINEHLDSQCQDFLEENDIQAAAACDNEQAKTSWPFSNNAPQSPDEEKNASIHDNNQGAKTSPYFKKSGTTRQESPKKCSHAGEVKIVSLGRLSSKLSKKVLFFSEDSKIHSTQVPIKEEPILSEPSSSQKENFDENVCVKSEHLVMNSTLTSQVPTENLHCVEKIEQATPKENSLGPEVSQTAETTASLRLIKRKKEESPGACIAPNMQKKTRYSLKRTAKSGSANPLPEVELGNSKCKDVERNQIMALDRGSDHPQDGSTSSVEHSSPRLPYYLQNFLTILGTVLENKDDRVLFSEEELSSIQRFKQLSVPGQMLYVRLFQRKLKWLQVSKLDYAEISSDISPVVQELVSSGFLQTESELTEIQDVLDLLPAPELRSLAKTFHLGGPGNSSQKQQLVEGLLLLSKQRSLFSLAPGQSNTGAIILKRAKQLAGSCVFLCRDPRAMFSRVFLLFSLTDTLEEEELASGGQGQLYTILLVNSGRLTFPVYTVQRSAQVFRDREDLIRYEVAMRTLQEVITAMQAGCWEDALVLYASAKSNWQNLTQTYDLSWQEQLPVFLRCFTVGWAYTRILSRGVEILQRLRRYKDAVDQLQSLLTQSVFCPDSRGRWWDRLALNLQQHLKCHEQAIYAIRDGLKDPLVRTGHRLSLHQRATRMKESASFKKYRLLLRDLPSIHVHSVAHVTIRGQLFPHEGGMGKSVFLRPAAGHEGSGEGGDAMVLCSVEELALAHYRELGFDQGIHGEGSTFSTLFGLLMWDVVFMNVLDVFRTSYQTCPLDLYTDCFYENRKEAIEARAELLSEASTETLQALLAEVWNSQEGRVCSLVNWERFSCLQQAQSLVACLGGQFLSGVVLRMSKDYRHSRGGLPDLVVWNTSNSSYKLVEVKGPNDRLSQKQQIWLDELQKLGADVEVCHVTAIGARGVRLE
ncbi:fanconi-associated nuclease 1 [Ictalurus furcatus]|uniref:fanconi-associated nuclease 1 n=1 Tax=Ictalurus furcatus TaxID=66913 RepID=UPI002350AD82|nr:fanconi-associated nuclease 1 [Ictalurus furcatus]XP_053479165.1 fanconi-associated nuclease 1 [Ictalurus furcatus]XP_053479166.1 fanconi-associated nuclease 1 [Ictalurus furcatus]